MGFSLLCFCLCVCVSWNVFTGQLFPLGQKLMEKQFLSLRGSKQWLLVIAWALSTRVIRYFVENYFVCSQLSPHFVVSSTHDIRSSAHLVVKVSTHVSLKIPRQLCREKHHLTCVFFACVFSYMASWGAEPAVDSGTGCCLHLSGVCTSVFHREPCPDEHLWEMTERSMYQYSVHYTKNKDRF